uniref:Uncharacterized protein n=1 Tax=Anguilla anguilla TaxID=7936 RepID=A0A0E9V5K2_ANGAN
MFRLPGNRVIVFLILKGFRYRELTHSFLFFLWYCSEWCLFWD